MLLMMYCAMEYLQHKGGCEDLTDIPFGSIMEEVYNKISRELTRHI